MKVEQSHWSEAESWAPSAPGQLGEAAQLVMIFASTALLKQKDRIDGIRRAYPKALLIGCSTAGEICGTKVRDNSLVCTAVRFDKTLVQGSSVAIGDSSLSVEAGKRLAGSLDKDGLAHVFVLSDGISVNGTELVRGMTENLPKGVNVTGGLAGDGSSFKETLVLWDGASKPGHVAAIGFYGTQLKVGYASLGGWDSFGPERVVTRSKGNVLYELDGKSALDLYKQYLGDDAKGLPATGLLYPLAVSITGSKPLVRTILSVDEASKSLTFAGDIPQGAQARLMSANFDRLIEGAVGAAKHTISGVKPDLAVLISCVGRKLILRQRIEEEVEGVREVLGEQAVLTGFYSYGEISPFTSNTKCELHNQTMTITTFSES